MNENKPSFWFLFHNDRLLLHRDKPQNPLPFGIEPPLKNGTHPIQEIGLIGDIPCRTFELSTPVDESDGFQMKGLREAYDDLQPEEYSLAGKALEMLHWDKTSRFCPACGTPMTHEKPIMKVCPSCGHTMFPAVSPATIVLIRKEDSVLLVHAHNFSRPFNSLVAGFVETGENLEECVRREVKEETGIEITNIRYFGSQPWPFPNTLMIGFIADYVSGEIELQAEELSSGAFYPRHALPEIPRKLSLARQMIDWWIADQEKKEKEKEQELNGLNCFYARPKQEVNGR